MIGRVNPAAVDIAYCQDPLRRNGSQSRGATTGESVDAFAISSARENILNRHKIRHVLRPVSYTVPLPNILPTLVFRQPRWCLEGCISAASVMKITLSEADRRFSASRTTLWRLRRNGLLAPPWLLADGRLETDPLERA
ncbi:hypothetical protein BBFGKLBO_03033 [Synechococcus sp. CBW1107]|nr:hypothetical protein BBFGKLBO_03033 [Synechococcus sp. CBW1107]